MLDARSDSDQGGFVWNRSSNSNSPLNILLTCEKPFWILSPTTSHPNIFTVPPHQFQCVPCPNAFIFPNVFHDVFCPKKCWGICYQVHLAFARQSF